MQTPSPSGVFINGRRLPQASQSPQLLREQAIAEVLRQAAVRQGALPEIAGEHAPTLDEAQREALAQWLNDAVVTPQADEEACARHYQANLAHYRHGQRAHVRHILFAVTPRVAVAALARRAELALIELRAADVAAQRFAQLARTLSNCPSGQNGGDLGCLSPHDCAPELAQFLFGQNPVANGVQPRLVQTRYGLHIVDVLAQWPGELAPLEQVRQRVRSELTQQCRATAMRQFLQLLVGQAHIQGIDLAGADSPLLQ